MAVPRCRWIPLRSSIAKTFSSIALSSAMLFATGPVHAQAAQPQSNEELLKIGAKEFHQCAYCHGNLGEGKPEIFTPAIAGHAEWYIIAQLANYQNCARGIHPDDHNGLRMRPMARTLRTYDGKNPTVPDRCISVDLKAEVGDVAHPDPKLLAVAKYTASLAPQIPAATLTGGSAVRGEKLYAVCASCHGADGKGNEALHAPALVQLDDWYIVNQLKSFKAGHRGANPAIDPWGATMRPNALMLSEQDMVDLADYILRLR